MKKICLIIGLLIILIPWIWFAYWYFGIYNPKTLIEYYPNGQISYEYHQAYWTFHWPQIDYYKNGQIYRQFYYDHWDPHWQFIIYYENGQEANIDYYYYWKQVWDSFSYRPTWEIRSQWRYIDWKPVDWEQIIHYENWDIEGIVTYKSWDILCWSTRYDRSWEVLTTNMFSWICVEPDVVYTPIEERTKVLQQSWWDWSNKEDVYPIEWLKALDDWLWVYPYSNFSSKSINNLIFFESTSEDWLISRYAIYDRENHKWLFDCFDWWGGWYIEVDESIDIDSIDAMSCKGKYDEAMNKKIDNIQAENSKTIPNIIDVLSRLNLTYKNLHRAFYYYWDSNISLLPWNWEITELSWFKIFTNDSSWKYKELLVWKEKEDSNSFKCYFCEWHTEVYDRMDWEDKNNIFLQWNWYSVSKDQLPWFKPLVDVGVQAFDWIVWYSEGYLILFPYKFPVDANSFQPTKWDRRYRVQNGWLQYHHYIWSDKDYVYYWDYAHWWEYRVWLYRIKKENDFKVLNTDEERKYIYDKETWLENVTWKNKFPYDEWDTKDHIDYSIFYQDWDMMYVTSTIWWEYGFWIWRFPIDGKTIKVEEMDNPEPISEYDTKTFSLSDKNYYYEIIENVNWYRIFQKIKK